MRLLPSQSNGLRRHAEPFAPRLRPPRGRRRGAGRGASAVSAGAERRQAADCWCAAGARAPAAGADACGNEPRRPSSVKGRDILPHVMRADRRGYTPNFELRPVPDAVVTLLTFAAQGTGGIPRSRGEGLRARRASDSPGRSATLAGRRRSWHSLFTVVLFWRVRRRGNRAVPSVSRRFAGVASRVADGTGFRTRVCVRWYALATHNADLVMLAASARPFRNLKHVNRNLLVRWRRRVRPGAWSRQRIERALFGESRSGSPRTQRGFEIPRDPRAGGAFRCGRANRHDPVGFTPARAGLPRSRRWASGPCRVHPRAGGALLSGPRDERFTPARAGGFLALAAPPQWVRCSPSRGRARSGRS